MPAARVPERLALYDLFMLGLSVYVLAALAASEALPLDAESRMVLGAADNAELRVERLERN